MPDRIAKNDWNAIGNLHDAWLSDLVVPKSICRPISNIISRWRSKANYTQYATAMPVINQAHCFATSGPRWDASVPISAYHLLVMRGRAKSCGTLFTIYVGTVLDMN